MPRYEDLPVVVLVELQLNCICNCNSLQSLPVATVPMVMFVWWEAPISMRVEWRCASMTSGGQYVMTSGTALMLLWSAGSWDMHTPEVSILLRLMCRCILICRNAQTGITY